MMPRTNRLSRTAFKEVLASARRRTSLHFSVSIHKTGSGPGECAVVISKKVAKSAVERHLLKRRVFSVAKKVLKPGFSFIIYARSGAQNLSFGALSKEIEELLAGVFQEV